MLHAVIESGSGTRFIAARVFTVWHTFPGSDRSAWVGRVEQLDPDAPGKQRWCIDSACGEANRERFDSRESAARRLIEIYARHFQYHETAG